jgi:membrane fusion protein, multidrug efflux system
MQPRLPYLVLVPFLGVFLAGCNRGQSQAPVIKPAAVRVAHPVVMEVTDYEEITGRTESADSVDLKARVTGYLKRDYLRGDKSGPAILAGGGGAAAALSKYPHLSAGKEGRVVEKGELLFEIDPESFEAEEKRTDAIRFQNMYRYERLKKDFARAEKLHKQQSMSDAEFDQISADYKDAQYSLKVAEASHKLAMINLDYTKVRAPFTGLVSRRFMDPGNLVKADETMLTSIVSLNPMYVYFDVDERTLLQIRHWMREEKIPGMQEKGAEVLMGLADEEGYPHKGTIDFIDNKLDPGTGTLRLRGVFDNTEKILYPGLFVRLQIQIGKRHPAVLVAERALGTDQGQKFLYLVNDKNKVVYQSVKLGSLHNGLRVVEDLLPYQLTDKSFAALRAAKVPEEILKKLAGLKKKLTEQPFRKELGKLLNKQEREEYQDQVLSAAQDFEKVKKDLVIVSGLQRVREGTEVEYAKVEDMLQQRPGQKKVASGK